MRTLIGKTDIAEKSYSGRLLLIAFPL